MPRGTVLVDEERCKGCGLCIAACPQHVLALSGRLNHSSYEVVAVEKPQSCMGCAFCALTCPDVAIAVFREKAAS